MPTKRRRIGHAAAFDGSESEHLELGPVWPLEEHLLAGSCTLCGAPEAIVRAAWEAHREALIRGWDFPFPMWAQVHFDGVELGPRCEPHSVYDFIAGQFELDA